MITPRPVGQRAFVLCLTYFLSVWCLAGQTPTSYDRAKSLNFGFVSPNTLDKSTFDDAIRRLNSPKELKLMNKALNLRCSIGASVKAYKALGSWSDGAEQSILITVTTDEQRMRYLVSLLGRDARQKAVLYFHQRTGGEATIYILHTRNKRRSLRNLASTLDQWKISFRTLVPLRRATAVYIVDLDGELRPKVMNAAKRLGAHVKTKTGTAQFIGDDSSLEKGTIAFENEITNFEATHKPLPRSCKKAKLSAVSLR